jgi:IclR family pca regulon transcriptional regulator
VSRRFLLTLDELGYVASRDGVFQLTPRVLELGYTFLSTMRLPDAAQPIMEDVVDRVHESCSVSVLDGAEIVYVVRVPAKRIMAISLAVGSRLPAYPTSMGRVLLAGLSRTELDAYFARAPLRRLTERTVTDRLELERVLSKVRERGWALVDQEVEVGVRSVAAPIHDRDGRVVAAINVSSHAARVNLKEMRTRHLPIVIDAARRISAALGGQPRSAAGVGRSLRPGP